MNSLQHVLITGLLLLSGHAYSQKYTYQEVRDGHHKMYIFDASGQHLGHYFIDAWDKQRVNVYDINKQLVNTIPINVLSHTQAEKWRPLREYIRNSTGEITGYKIVDIMDKDIVNVFSLDGAMIGYYERDVWTGEWEWRGQ